MIQKFNHQIFTSILKQLITSNVQDVLIQSNSMIIYIRMAIPYWTAKFTPANIFYNGNLGSNHQI